MDGMESPTLVEFLTARMDEERAAVWDEPDFIEDHDSGRSPGWGTRGCHLCEWQSFGGRESVTKDEWAEHVYEVHQSQRVLREVEAKRRIVESCVYVLRATGKAQLGWAAQGDAVLRILASAYSDHPDFREEWRP